MDEVNENGWIASSDVSTMLAFVAGRDAPSGAVVPLMAMNERKLRLFLVGCCRLRWELFTTHDFRNALLVAERMADVPVAAEEIAHWENVTNELIANVISRHDSITDSQMRF